MVLAVRWAPDTPPRVAADRVTVEETLAPNGALTVETSTRPSV